MKNILILLILSCMAYSCGMSRQNYTEASVQDTTTVVKNYNMLPYQDPDRLTGSVSPRAEEVPYEGSQGPNGSNNDILEPLRSRSTRSYNSHPTNYNSGGGNQGLYRATPPERKRD